MYIKHFLIFLLLLHINTANAQQSQMPEEVYVQIKKGLKQRIDDYCTYITDLADPQTSPAIKSKCYEILVRMFYDPENCTVQVSSSKSGMVGTRTLKVYLHNLMSLKYESINFINIGEVQITTIETRADGTFMGNATYTQQFTANRHAEVSMTGEMSTVQMGSNRGIGDQTVKNVQFVVKPFTVETREHKEITGYNIFFGNISVLHTEKI